MSRIEINYEPLCELCGTIYFPPIGGREATTMRLRLTESSLPGWVEVGLLQNNINKIKRLFEDGN